VNPIEETIKKNGGVIFAEPAIVHRVAYSGRNIVGPNDSFTAPLMDGRGYLPVEWWVMSITQAENDARVDGEGVSNLVLADGSTMRLDHAARESETLLFGPYRSRWPLTKILDIGGKPVKTSFSSEPEVPPIPCHLHSGVPVNGVANIASGKLEAYFLPPVDVAPYEQDFGRVKTRLGVKPSTSRGAFLNGMRKFGIDDELYALLNEFEVRPFDGWIIPPGVVHAPGPWTTFEIQLPQDDFNLLAWRLGQRIPANELASQREAQLLRGLGSEEEVLEKLVAWDATARPDFEQAYRRPSRIIEEGAWGAKRQIFFDQFYGESLEVKPGMSYAVTGDKPVAAVLWSGHGTVNGLALDHGNGREREFLITPNARATVANAGPSNLMLFLVHPLTIDRKY